MTKTGTVRYDGLADWYDGFHRPHAQAHVADLVRLLGPGYGRCLDLACGTGLYAEAIASTGRTVVGLDVSSDQLRLAAGRTRRLVRADAAALPFGTGTFRTVTALWMSTDVDDFAAVLAESARVLEPSGMLLFSGVHPCFNGPHTEVRDDGSRIVHPIYDRPGWHTEAPWWGENVRRKVGMRHVPLAALFNAFTEAGLIIDQVEEPAPQDGSAIPWSLTIRAFRAPITFRIARPSVDS